MRVSSKFKRAFLAVIAIGAAMLTPFGAQAQTTTTTTTTWKGSDIDVLTLAGTTSTSAEADKQFLLYNVGTGKFIMTGGGWGIEAMLTLQDYGMPFTTYKQDVPTVQSHNFNTSDKQRVFAANVHTEVDAYALGCNMYDWTAGNRNAQVMNAILDARPAYYFTNGGTYYYFCDWDLIRVETDDNSETHTYYLKERVRKDNSSSTVGTEYFYLGAVSGNNEGTQDASRTAYYSTGDANTIPTEVQDNANYQWRLVSRKEFEDAQTETDANAFGGLNANVTYLLDDPYFSRNLITFSSWTVSTDETTKTITNNQRREDWTQGSIYTATVNGQTVNLYNTDASVTHTSTASRSFLYDESWDQAVFRKLQPTSWPDGQTQMDYARYEMATFEGKGSAYQTITAPQTGIYQLQVAGYSSDATAPGSLFVADENGNVINSVTLPTLTEAQSLYTVGTTANRNGSYLVTSNSYPGWINAAKYLNDNAPAYTVSLIFEATKGTKYRIGVMKQNAVRSDQSWDGTVNNVLYRFYFDKSYAAVDNFQMHYLGPTAPFVLNDNKVSDDYIKNEADFTNRTVYLKRHPGINQWQSIILPVTISTNVFKEAFGEDARLGELEGIGKAEANSPTSIDFKKVSLDPNKDAIEAGKFYLIYATKAPELIEYTDNNQPVSGNFYRLGRQSMTNNSSFSSTVGPTVVSGSNYSGTGKPFTDGTLSVAGTYIKTPSSLANNYAPAGSYFVQNGNMYYLKDNSRVYGFQWWIIPTPGSNPAKYGLTFNFVDPTNDNTVTYISGVSLDRKPQTEASTAVYNLAGERVANDASALQNLPSGIYITNGKKIFKR